MPRRPLLEFEKPLVELEQQIEQIRQLARDSEVDVSQQLQQLESLAARRRQEIFQGLTPAQKIQVARHSQRPSTLDFIQMFCEDWVELHEDRRGNDDQAKHDGGHDARNGAMGGRLDGRQHDASRLRVVGCAPAAEKVTRFGSAGAGRLWGQGSRDGR